MSCRMGVDLIHSHLIIIVAVFAQDFEFAVCVYDTDRRMMDAVEHASLDGGIMYHVFENNVFADR